MIVSSRWPAQSYLSSRQTRQSAATLVGLLAVAWLLSVLPLLWAGVVVMGGGAGLFLLRFPWLIWPLLAIGLPFTSSLKIGPLSWTDVLFAVAILLWFLDGVRRNTLRLQMGFLPAILAAYLLVLLLSLSNALDLQEAATEVIKWVQVLIAIWLVQETLAAGQGRWLIWALLAAAVLQGALGIYQFVFRVGPPHFLLLERFMRAAGTFQQPNPYAGYLGLTLPVAVSFLLYFLGRVKTMAGTAQELGAVAAYGIAVGVIGLGLLASWSRGGWLGALLGIGVVLLLRSRPSATGPRSPVRWGAAFAGLLVLFLAGDAVGRFIPTSLADRLAALSAYLGLHMWEIVQQPLTPDNYSVIERLAHWIAALRMWEVSPWLGVGPGNYAAVYPSVRLPGWEEPLGHAHNIYLNVLAETGLVGLFAYLLLWTGIFGWLLRQLRQMQRIGTDGGFAPCAAMAARPSWHVALIVGVLGVIVHLSVHNLFDNLYVQGMYLHIALWLGAVATMTNHVATPPQIADVAKQTDQFWAGSI